jgi:hypothetical protein
LGAPDASVAAIWSSAMAGFDLNVTSSGTRAFFRRAASPAQSSGRHNRYATGRLAA